MTAPRLTAAIFALAAALSVAAFAAPRAAGQGGLSTTVKEGQRPAQEQTNDQQDDIDSYLEESRIEKHIFGNSLPKNNNGQHIEIQQPVYSSQPQTQSQTSTKQDDRKAYDSSGQILNNQQQNNNPSSSNTAPYNGQNSEPHNSNGQISSNTNSGLYVSNGQSASNIGPYNGQNSGSSGPYTSNSPSSSNTEYSGPNLGNSGPYNNNSPSAINTNLGSSRPYTSNGQSSSNSVPYNGQNLGNSGPYTGNGPSSSNTEYNGQQLDNSGPYTGNGPSSSNTKYNGQQLDNSGPYTSNGPSSSNTEYNGQQLDNSGPYNSNGPSASNTNSGNSELYKGSSLSSSNTVPYNGQSLGNSGPYNSNGPSTNTDQSSSNSPPYRPNESNPAPINNIRQNSNNPHTDSDYNTHVSDLHKVNNAPNAPPPYLLAQDITNSKPISNFAPSLNNVPNSNPNVGNSQDHMNYDSNTRPQTDYNLNTQNGVVQPNYISNQPSSTNPQNYYPNQSPQIINEHLSGNNEKPMSHLPESNIPVRDTKPSKVPYNPDSTNNQQNQNYHSQPNESTNNNYDEHHKNGQNGYSESVQPTTLQERPVRYDGSQLWKIPIDERFKLKVVGSLSAHQAITTWGGNRTIVDALIAANMIANVSEALRRSGIPYEVVITDLQRNIEEENPPLDEEQLELQNRKGHRMSWDQYHRVDDINGYLDYLAHTYPRTCSVRTIGQSYEGRDIKLLKISNGRKNNKAVFIDGGIHAREWIAPATVTYIINHIVENYDNGPDIYRQIDWYAVPVLNPDGYEFAHTTNRLWRKNRSGNGACKGVDLNRNFGYKWGGKGTSNSPCSEVYRGSSAFSEPESRAFRDFFTSSDADFKLYVSYHSYGQFLLHPWGYDEVVPPDYLDLESAAKKAAHAIAKVDGTKYTVGASSLVLYASAGGSDDWLKAQGIKYSYTMELRDTGYYGFVLPAKYILKVGQESLQGLMVLAGVATGA